MLMSKYKQIVRENTIKRLKNVGIYLNYPPLTECMTQGHNLSGI